MPSAPMSPEVLFVFQFGILVILTCIGGYWFRRWLRLPSVIGEMLIGVIIGPFALGRFIPLAGVPLFDPSVGANGISPELHAVSNLAAIVLLFLSGLETDLSSFLRYSFTGTLVGLGGVLFSFALGAGCAVICGVAPSFSSPPALFLGAISCATSVGITARILAERRKMDSPEGTTILAAAVLDDVLGLIALAITVGMSKSALAGKPLDWTGIGIVAAKALGFWIGATAISLLAARRFSRFLKYFRTPQAISALAFGFALLLAGLSESAGLAMIIGAYIMGLALSRTDLVQVIQHQIQPIHNLFVPVFFATMGMMVDLSAIANASILKLGLLYTALAILAKVVGCFIPAFCCGFNRHGALRVGVGMLPRGEVALIVAGIGLSSGAIAHDLFGVAVLMTLLTTILGPLLLAGSFENPVGGLRREKAPSASLRRISLACPSSDLADYFRSVIIASFRNEEFYVYRLSPDVSEYQIRKNDILVSFSVDGASLVLTASEKDEQLVRLLVSDALLKVRSALQSIQDPTNGCITQLVENLYSDSPAK